MIRYSVGFSLRAPEEEPFSALAEAYRDSIREVFFSPPDMPSGRGRMSADEETALRMEEELRRIRDRGIRLDVLFNGNCYGALSLSNELADKVCATLRHLDKTVGEVDIVTTTSPAIAHTVKKHFPHKEVRASVNMKIGTVKGMEYLADLFDSYHVQREYNRDLAHLATLKAWADERGKKLVLLANSGCFAHCSGQIFHDNNVAHQEEICLQDNLTDFNPYVCWRCLQKQENWPMLLQNTWIRPEDIDRYESITDTVKLATRIHSLPGLVIDAYARRAFCGNTLDLFEPTFSGALAPYVIHHGAFPADWFQKTTSCDKQCHRCGYCRQVLDTVLLNTETL